MSKGIFTSKTFWWNALTLTAAAVAALSQQELIADNPAAAGGLAALAAIVNMGLRLVTTKAIK